MKPAQNEPKKKKKKRRRKNEKRKKKDDVEVETEIPTSLRFIKQHK